MEEFIWGKYGHIKMYIVHLFKTVSIVDKFKLFISGKQV